MLSVRIENDLSRRRRIGYGNAKLLTVAVLVESIGVNHIFAPDQVGFAFLQCENTRLIVGNDLDDNATEGRLFTPIILVALEDCVFVDDVFFQNPRAGTDKGRHAVFGGAVFHNLRADEGKGTRDGQFREHRVIGLAHAHHEGVGIRRLGRDEKAHHLEPGVTFLVVNDGVEICLYGIGVQFLAVAEGDAGTNLERIGKSVGRDRPTFRNGRMVRAVISKRDEPLEKHFLREHFSTVQMRI